MSPSNEKFYSDQHRLLQSTPADDKVLILGDFNARVGRDSEALKGVLGRRGIGNCNDNGRLLLEVCREHQFTNVTFQQRDSLKTTWMHPRSKQWHLLDYVLVRQRDQKDALHTTLMPTTECQTDHRLVRCKLKLQSQQEKTQRWQPPLSRSSRQVCSANLRNQPAQLNPLQTLCGTN